MTYLDVWRSGTFSLCSCKAAFWTQETSFYGLCLQSIIYSLAFFPGICYSSTRPGTSYHMTQFYQASPALVLQARGWQRAILAYEISWFLFDFPVISLINDVICCKKKKSGWGWRVGLISELDFKEICFDFSWFQTDFSTRCTRFLSLPTPRVRLIVSSDLAVTRHFPPA